MAQALIDHLPEGARQTVDYSTFVRPTESGCSRMDIAVQDISCPSCAMSIERGLAGVPGIVSARVNVGLKRVSVEWNPAVMQGERILERLDELGYPGYPFASGQVENAESKATVRLLRCVGVAAFGAMNIMLLSVSVWSGNASDITPETRDFFHWVSALIALPVVAYSGRPFFDSAFAALRNRSVNMDVPITIGVILTLAMSVVMTWQHAEHAYFDSAVMLIFFLLIGRLLDQMLRRRARDLAANIAVLRAETALKVMADGSLIETPVRAIAPGDSVLVRPADRIAVDGVVVTGRSHVDQSLVTGETLHASVGPGDQVYGGTINVDGTLTLTVTASIEGSLLDEIEKLLSRASEVRSGYVRLADRAARLYAPFVHTAALLTFFGWLLAGAQWSQAMIIAVTVLIITCPCALGLAIPAVQITASGALFREGIVLASGDAIERLAEVDTVVFDKTGTLTQPEARLLNLPDIAPDVLSLAGRLALSSRHPLAQALAKACAAQEPIEGAREIAGQGITAFVAGREIRLGSAVFCDAGQEAARAAAQWPQASLLVFRDGNAVSLFAIGQQLRPDASATIAALKARGLAVEILSGDNPAAVADIAGKLGVGTFRAAATPAAKCEYLEKLRQAGRKTLMVGDGLNDAPALASAHVSLSPSSAAHLSQSAADAMFLGDRLMPVVRSIDLARKGRKLMMQNLWFAVLYNVIAVPVAIAGLATPLIAALAMSGSSMVVTLNALRARSVSGEAQT